MTALTYVFTDVELDGPDPGKNSMRSIGCSAWSDAGEELGAFTRNLSPLEGSEPASDTLAWWRQRPEAWEEVLRDAVDPREAMTDFAAWVRSLPGDPVFAAHPLVLDGLWVDWYLRRFTGHRLFHGASDGTPLFVGAGLDLPSYLQALLGLPYVRTRPVYPADLLVGVNHTHRAIDDARGHATLFFNARRKAAKDTATEG